MKIRRIITLTVFLSFLCLALSGIMLFFSPQGRVAYWAGWTFLGLEKDQYSAIHTTFMVLFLVVGIWHIVLNWRAITGYLKNRAREVRIVTPESSIAFAVVLLFVLGPLLGFPPFRQFLDAGEDVKAYWESVRGAPPWGHAEENPLSRFCRGMEDFERIENQRLVSIDCDDAVAALRAEGLAVAGSDERLVDIARANGTTPQALAGIIQGVAQPISPGQALAALVPGGTDLRFRIPYSGLGRMTLREYAREYGYDLEEILGILTGGGVEVDPDTRLREEATRLGVDPEGVIEIMNREARPDSTGS
jgi:hypothetical protein